MRIPCLDNGQQPAKAENPVRMIRQEFINGFLSFLVEGGGEVVYRLSASGPTIESSMKPDTSLIVPKQTFDMAAICAEEHPEWSRILPRLKCHLEPFFGKMKGDPAAVVALYILATYSFRRSKSIQTLWLHAPQPFVREVLGRILESVSFNGVLIYPYHQFDLILKAIESATPTLIFLEPDKFGRSVREPLLEYHNSASRTLPTDTGQLAPIFSPKIVISGELPKRNLWANSIFVTVPIVSRNSNVANGDWYLRSLMAGFSLCKLSVNSFATSTEYYSFPERSHHLRGVLSALSSVAGPTTDLQPLEEILEGHSVPMANQYERTIKHEILIALEEFLFAYPKYAVADAWIPLQAILTHMHKNNEFLKQLNSTKLSQALNDFKRLLLDSNRFLVEVTVKKGRKSVTEKRKLTCIKINRNVLEELIGPKELIMKENNV